MMRGSLGAITGSLGRLLSCAGVTQSPVTGPIVGRDAGVGVYVACVTVGVVESFPAKRSGANIAKTPASNATAVSDAATATSKRMRFSALCAEENRGSLAIYPIAVSIVWRANAVVSRETSPSGGMSV